tara:strand:- start:33319 stop:33972 length:654 start_codon:yes stop_codon:yes gene_type:complete
MPFSKQRFEQLQQEIRQALVSTNINDWERAFLRDMKTKLDRFGLWTRLTDKQYRRIMKLTNGGIGGSEAFGETSRTRWRRRGVRSWTPSIGSILISLGLIAFVGYKAVERFPEYLGPMVRITSTSQISGPVTRVRDGDTIEISRVPIRFGSLDCAEQDTLEGQRATARMRTLISGQSLTCFLNGRTSYDRKIGSCMLPDGRDLAGIMISDGYCGRYW